MAHDGKSLFFAESWACRVHRYWLEGPKAGTAECVIRDMPGYPDNINRASDGNYWMAWLGMRTPSFDLSLRHPGMRKRMTRRLPQDEWLFPNINTGGVVKFDETGGIVEALRRPLRRRASDGHLDARAQGLSLRRRHPQQPHRPLQDCRRRPELDQPGFLLGSEAMILDPILDMFRGKAVTIPPLDGAFRPNTALDDAPASSPTLTEPDNLLVSAGDRSARLQRQRRLFDRCRREPDVVETFPSPVTALAAVAIGRTGGRPRKRQAADRRQGGLAAGRHRLHHRACLRRRRHAVAGQRLGRACAVRNGRPT